MVTNENRSSSGQWIGTPLHDFLAVTFGGYVDGRGGLLVIKLASDMNMSREGFYKWLRTGRLSKSGVENLHKFAVKVCPDTAPSREEFSKFLFA